MAEAAGISTASSRPERLASSPSSKRTGGGITPSGALARGDRTMKTPQSLIMIALTALALFELKPGLAQATRTDNQIAYYEQLLKRDQQNARAYYALGDAMIRKARETGDMSYFNRAETALKKL